MQRRVCEQGLRRQATIRSEKKNKLGCMYLFLYLFYLFICRSETSNLNEFKKPFKSSLCVKKKSVNNHF